MASAFPSGSPDGSKIKPSFRKPSNDAANRKYRRHSPTDGSDSSSAGGSPKRESSPNYSKDDRARSYDDRRRREIDSNRNRSSRGSDSYRHSDRHPSGNSHNPRRCDDYSKYSRHADGEDRGSHRSSHSDRDSRYGTRSDYSRNDKSSIHDRSREGWRSIDKYSRDKSENVEHRSMDKGRENLLSEHHRQHEKDSDRLASGSKHANSSRNGVMIGEKGREGDREARDERRNNLKSPVEADVKGLALGRDHGYAHYKDIIKSGGDEMYEQRDDKVHKRKYSDKESAKHRQYTGDHEEGTRSESKSLATNEDPGRPKEHMLENQNSSDKKLKLGHAEEIYSNSAEEKRFSSSNQIKEATGKFTSAPTTNATNQAEIAQDLDAAKVKAMQAAELVNKNLVGGGFLSTDQKKKLLWGNKKSTTAEESSNRWDVQLFADRERQEKFNKLMGVKGDVNLEHKPSDKDGNLHAEKQEQLKIDLEKQYTAGLRRRDGRTVGLGL